MIIIWRQCYYNVRFELINSLLLANLSKWFSSKLFKFYIKYYLKIWDNIWNNIWYKWGYKLIFVKEYSDIFLWLERINYVDFQTPRHNTKHSIWRKRKISWWSVHYPISKNQCAKISTEKGPTVLYWNRIKNDRIMASKPCA